MKYLFFVHGKTFKFASNANYEEFLSSCVRLTECSKLISDFSHAVYNISVSNFSHAVYDMLCDAMSRVGKTNFFNCDVVKAEDHWCFLDYCDIICLFNFDEGYVKFSDELVSVDGIAIGKDPTNFVSYKYNEKTEKFDICNSEK